jgi:fermentation-respiration switch protein FrsA (DUF1100 family)
MAKRLTRRERVRLVSDGIALVGELLVPVNPAGLVVLCHGIPLAPPDPTDAGYTLLAGRLAAHGYAALFVNLRGTGGSGGDFHIGGWYRDMAEVMAFARREFRSRLDRIFMAGFSAGGALAVRYVAENGGVDGIAAFAAPARLSDVLTRDGVPDFLDLARATGIIKSPDFPPDADWFYRDLLENDAVEYVGRVSPAPLLVIHGEDDETVPVEQAETLFQAAGEPKQLLLLSGGAHRLRRDPRILDYLVEWLDGLRA